MNLDWLDDAFAETCGVFTTGMLQQYGVSARAARRWLERGWITRLYGRAYVRCHTEPTLRRRAIAVGLTWPDAIVCLRTAALLHEMPVVDDGGAHALVPDTRRASHGIQTHRWSVRPTAVARTGLVVMTDRRTTLADCLGRLPEDEAWGMLAWMWTREQVTLEDLDSQLRERHHLYGIVRLRLMVAAVRRGALSVGELHLQDFLIDNGLSGWTGDFVLRRHGRVVARGDIGFGHRRLIVEFDGRIAHNETTAERDARRERRINGLGYDVLHVTWALLHNHPRLLRDTLREVLVAPPRSLRRRELIEALSRRDRTQVQLRTAPTASKAG